MIWELTIPSSGLMMSAPMLTADIGVEFFIRIPYNEGMDKTQIPRCEWCGKSVDGDAGADAGPGTTVLCWTCRSIPDEACHAVDYTSPHGA